MKKLVATMSDDNCFYYTKYTIPIFKKWAKKWGADFKILSHDSGFGSEVQYVNYRTMIFPDLLNEYDQIAYFDGDMVINKNCPNVFDVPRDTIGMVLEDKGTRKIFRHATIKQANETLGDIGWYEDYFNGGFYVISSQHKEMFQTVNGKIWRKKGFESVLYMYNIKKFGLKYIDLGYKFNHTSMFSELWHGSKNRFDSFIIHYAGGGNFPDKGDMDRTDFMIHDIFKIYGNIKCASLS